MSGANAARIGLIMLSLMLMRHQDRPLDHQGRELSPAGQTEGRPPCIYENGALYRSDGAGDTGFVRVSSLADDRAPVRLQMFAACQMLQARTIHSPTRPAANAERS
jgi:hypothetical protein